MEAKALIFHMSISCDKTFLCAPTLLTLWPSPYYLVLEYYLLLENIKLVKNFWTVSATVYSFHMNIYSGKVFPWVLVFFTLWHWSWNLTYFLNPLTCLITFEHWVLNLWFFTWKFYETRLPWVPTILNIWHLPWRLTCFFKTFSLANIRTFELWVIEFIHFTLLFHSGKAFPLVLTFATFRNTLF